jgi:predicted O-methyltransferase YrrM
MDFRETAERKRFGVMHKLTSYFPEYDFCFSAYREKPVRLLEIGVAEGGSLATWEAYFPNAEQIVGLDIKPECAKFTEGKRKVYIGSQTDRELLQSISAKEGPFDIIIDDGGHTMKQQIVSFETLFPMLKDGGIYVIEDLHTSYWPEFRDRRKTAISFLKDRVDDLHFWARRSHRALPIGVWGRNKVSGILARFGVKARPKNIYERNIRSIYFAGSICFIFKECVDKGHTVKF